MPLVWQSFTPKRAERSGIDKSTGLVVALGDDGRVLPIERVTTWSSDAVLELVRAEHDPNIAAVTWIGSGHWSDCFAFTSGDGDNVVRIGRHVEDFRKDAFAARFNRPGLPIPAVSKVDRAGDDWFAISARVHGEPLEQVDSWDELIPGVTDLLDALRTIDLHETSGWGRWDATGTAPSLTWRSFLLQVDQDPPGSRVHGWKEQLASTPAAARRFADGYEQLQLIATNDVPRSMVHNDLINRNTHVLGGAVSGVFDWGTLCLATISMTSRCSISGNPGCLGSSIMPYLHR